MRQVRIERNHRRYSEAASTCSVVSAVGAFGLQPFTLNRKTLHPKPVFRGPRELGLWGV